MNKGKKISSIKMHILCIAVFLPLFSFSQNASYWPFAGRGFQNKALPAYALDFSVEPPRLIPNRNILAFCGNTAAYDSLGDLMFASNGIESFDAKGKILQNGKHDFSFLTLKAHENVLATPDPGNPNEYYLFFAGVNAKHVDDEKGRRQKSPYKSLKLTYLKFKKGTKQKKEFLSSNPISVSSEYAIGLEAISHANGKDIWLVTRSESGSYLIYLLSENGIELKHALSFAELRVFDHALFRASHNGSLFITVLENWDVHTESKLNVYQYHFDNEKGLLSNQKILLNEDTYPYPINQTHDHLRRILDFEYSPNDSLIYFSSEFAYVKGAEYSVPLVQFSLYSDNFKKSLAWIYRSKFNTETKPIALKLGPNGKIYCGGSNDKFLHVIKKPNQSGAKCQFLPKQYDLNVNSGLVAFSHFPNIFEQRAKLQFNYSALCGGKVTLSINTDTLKFKKFIVFFGDGDSSELMDIKSIRTDKGSLKYSHNYSKAGNYDVRLMGVSQNGYRQWYSDTIVVDKEHFTPHASFKMNDSLNCQWIQTKFINQSLFPYNLDSNKCNWREESGEFDTIYYSSNDHSHIFNNSGNYITSLIASNGICSDTFKLDKPIEILPAPEPGVFLSKESGCSPMNLEVKSSNQNLQIDYIIYNWGDGDVDSLTKSNAHHLYKKSGTYSIIRKLVGPSGCITHDTSFILVKRGLGENYSPKLDPVSFTSPSLVWGDSENELLASNQHIQLSWNYNPNAHEYVVSKNGIQIGITKDTSYIDLGIDVNKNYKGRTPEYNVFAINQCGEQSLKSGTGSPLMLHTFLADNSANLNWDYADPRYELKDANLISVTEENETKLANSEIIVPNKNFVDESFQQESGVELCYYLQLKDNHRPYLSNVSCIDHITICLIPSAFSPNEDGLNDEWKPYIKGAKNYKVLIYNRWGEQVFESNDPKTSWIVQNNNPQIYYYLITFTDNNNFFNQRSGTITSIK